MLKNYIKIAYRNLLKNKIFSFINILGLAIGMAACLLIIHYVRFELSYENSHEHADNIYRVTLDLYNGSEYVVTDCETYGPLAPMLKEKFPEVLNFVRMFHNEVQEVKVGDSRFYEDQVYFADSTVFQVFTYPLRYGDPQTALVAPHQVVLNVSTAIKYFGKANVVGEAIELNNELYQISGVMEDLPPNTHLKFNFLLSHTTINKMWEWYEKYGWSGNNEYTYLLMQEGTDLTAFNDKLLALSRSLEDKIDGDIFVAEPINNIHLYSHKTFEPEVNGKAEVVYTLLIIAIFIIIIAWVNYINLSTARAIERSREVGIRKVMGSARAQLITQFMLESFIVCLLASTIALTLLQLSLPAFRDIAGQPLPLNVVQDPYFWYLVLSILGIGAVVSGLYPALVLSSFRPVTVLKGKLKTSTHGQWLRKGLVVAQFAATIALLAGTITVYLQIKHLRDQDLGVNVKQTLALHTPLLNVDDSLYYTSYISFKNELIRETEIEEVALSESLPGLSLHELSTTTGIQRVGDEEANGYNYYIIRIDEDFIPLMNIELIEGRNFDRQGDYSRQVIINEEAVKTLGFSSATEAVGDQITAGGDANTIIGVIKNYHQRSPKEAHLPMIFPYLTTGSYFTMKLNSQHMQQRLAEIEEVWQRVFPDNAFNYFFLDEKYDQQYRADTQFGQVIAIFSSLAIFIACLGLFGLSSFTIVQRTKEIGVRKVLGASVAQIVRLLSQDYIKLVLLASIIALPLAYIALQAWLDGYASRIKMNFLVLGSPLIIVLLIAVITVSIQTIKAAFANPARSLRYE